jgi:hypothetical protein
MKQALIFTLKVWLTVLIVVPIPLLRLQNNIGWTATHYLTEYFWVVIGELMLYSPLIIFFFFLTFWANRKLWTLKNKKLVILGLAELLYLLATELFLIFFTNIRTFDPYHLEYLAINVIVIGFGTLFYKLNSVTELAA